MNKKVGFIGAGKMAQAMIEGILKSKLISTENIMASASTEKTIDYINKTYGIIATTNNKDVLRFADILILAVNPDLYPMIIDEIKHEMNQNT
ncbi:MAG TPA: NAD(P)-binding domain-containing protein, partial [Neobacillus sp.]